MKKKFLLGAAIAALCVFSLIGCNQKSEQTTAAAENIATTQGDSSANDEAVVDAVEKTEDKAPLRVATNPTFKPASYKDDNGELTGFEPALMEEIGKRIGRDIEWLEIEGMDNLFGNLDAGKVDTIAFQVSINEQRKENYTFSHVYGHNKIYLATRDDFKYDTLDDLQGKRVSLSPTHSMYPILQEYNADLPDNKKIIIQPAESASLYDDLELGRTDAFPLTEVAYEAAMEQKPWKIKLSGPALVIEENAYPFAKDADTELLDEVNRAIDDMLEDGTLKDISMEYYKVDVTKAGD